MDSYSSGEELLIKTRKPYTITKQRERWTEEEHDRFLEALKLYGRAWQRIEEHIGTKTAVQIRSHAQKFFSKLEKEALIKGVPIGQAIDIEIPPPRPKRKPSNPYPCKIGTVCSPTPQVRAKEKHIPHSPSHSSKQELVADLERKSQPEKHVSDDREKNDEGTCADDKCLIPRESPDKPDSVAIAQNDSNNETHAAKSFPRHAPVQILDGSQGTCSQGLSSDVSYQELRAQMEFPGQPAIFGYPAVSSAVESQNNTLTTSNQQIYPNFHPSFIPFPINHGDYSSFLQMSPTCWPMRNVENLDNSPIRNTAAFGHEPMHPAPSLAAIAAATVAAATAWWAAHGLLPCAPYPFAPISVASPFVNVGETSVANDHKEENYFKIPGSEVQQPEQDLSDSGNSGVLMEIGVATTIAEEVPPISVGKDMSKVKNKLVDRSSCGSNTPSGSDLEADALEQKNKRNDESKEPGENHSGDELNDRRSQIFVNTNDNWKEVSDEGRLAFKALFSRGRLPQSFSPPQHPTNKEENKDDGFGHQWQNSEGSHEEAFQLDLNINLQESVSSDQGMRELEPQCQGNVNNEDGLLTIGALESKLQSNRSGFRPYKRCSVEAKEIRVMNSSNQEQGNCMKRLRLQAEASI